MKTTKSLLVVALIGAASLSAHAGVRFGFPFGLPLPIPVVVAAPIAPVVVSTPVYASAVYAPSVYVRGPGYWPVCGYSRGWAPGYWHSGAVRVGYGRPYGWRR